MLNEIFNDAYMKAYAATKDEGIAHKMGMQAVRELLIKSRFSCRRTERRLYSYNYEKKFVEDISIGVQQGKNNQWKTNRMSWQEKKLMMSY